MQAFRILAIGVVLLMVWSGHATAGSGWYLMAPPSNYQPTTLPPDSWGDARARLFRVTPLSRWAHAQSYDRLAECQADLWRQRDDTLAAAKHAHNAELQKSANDNLQRAMLSLCVASDDARLR